MEQTESQILIKIRRNLKLFCPSVIWIDRLNAGAIHSGNLHMKLCKPGTPDLYAIIREGGGHIIFIECKREGGKQSDEQKEFEKMVEGLNNVHYMVAHSLSEVINNIKIILDKSL